MTHKNDKTLHTAFSSSGVFAFAGLPAKAKNARTKLKQNSTGLSVRADNFHVIPLCHTHHRTGGHGVAVHVGRKTWEKNFGTEAELLAQVIDELGGSE